MLQRVLESIRMRQIAFFLISGGGGLGGGLVGGWGGVGDAPESLAQLHV